MFLSLKKSRAVNLSELISSVAGNQLCEEGHRTECVVR